MRDLPHRLNFRGVTVDVSDWLREAGKPLGHQGLLFDVAVRAHSMEEAVGLGLGAAKDASDLLTAAHAAAIGDPTPLIVLEEAPDGAGLRIGQYFFGPQWQQGPRRKFRPESLTALVTSMNRTQGNGSTRRRIKRSVGKIRRALLESDPIDQFEDLWQALEALNPLIQKSIGLDDWFPGTPCPNCGEQTRVKGQSSGIRHAICEFMGWPAGRWKQLHALRRDIVHSLKDPATIRRDAAEASVELLAAALTALTELLDIAPETRADLIRAGLPLVERPRFFVKATLVGHSLNAVAEDGAYPFFLVSFASPGLAEAGENSWTESTKTDLRIQNFSGEVHDLELVGQAQTDPEDPTAKFVMQRTTPP